MRRQPSSHPPAVVMNMFYTGLGIARSLGEHGVPVIGLSSSPGVYGEFTRYARIRRCPDSRHEPEQLLRFFLAFGAELEQRTVVFPTRDDDVLFLDRYRDELSRHFDLVVPSSHAVRSTLDKWQTFVDAQKAGVPAPETWLIEKRQDLQTILPQLSYPCVVKPVESYHWRRGNKWRQVGGRKAFSVASEAELIREYAAIAEADERAVIQQLVAGGDDRLVVVACYVNRNGDPVAAFYGRKILQEPEGFGTGLVVQTADHPELLERTVRLLRVMQFTGIAEVEYKWDERKQTWQLIEVNPRPWDQHRLGNCCGVNLMHLAYCEHAGLPLPDATLKPADVKWVAEDTFCIAVLYSLWKRNGRERRLFDAIKGNRCYAIWSLTDPLPLLGYLFRRFVPSLVTVAVAAFRQRSGNSTGANPAFAQPREWQKGKSGG